MAWIPNMMLTWALQFLIQVPLLLICYSEPRGSAVSFGIAIAIYHTNADKSVSCEPIFEPNHWPFYLDLVCFFSEAYQLFQIYWWIQWNKQGTSSPQSHQLDSLVQGIQSSCWWHFQDSSGGMAASADPVERRISPGRCHCNSSQFYASSCSVRNSVESHCHSHHTLHSAPALSSDPNWWSAISILQISFRSWSIDGAHSDRTWPVQHHPARSQALPPEHMRRRISALSSTLCLHSSMPHQLKPRVPQNV